MEQRLRELKDQVVPLQSCLTKQLLLVISLNSGRDPLVAKRNRIKHLVLTMLDQKLEEVEGIVSADLHRIFQQTMLNSTGTNLTQATCRAEKGRGTFRNLSHLHKQESYPYLTCIKEAPKMVVALRDQAETEAITLTAHRRPVLVLA